MDALTEAFGSTCVAGMKNAVLGMDERTVALQQEYNALVSTYQQIYGGALVELDGKQLTIPSLAPTRRAPTPPSAGPLMRPKPVTSTPTAPSWTSCTPRSSRT